MRIKNIEINGFKSYGFKTEIKEFDPLFNAITGLNGSGKSNILDAICFVLGITNLSQVRANNFQELVYKNGQAGVNKAAVSIVFDNSDSRQSPIGYETYKEITVTRIVVIGGRNKYLINGATAHNNRVQDFFQSVHLNVNNPHFLIMQGRITKVLNMKPEEILSMIEEAAGTRMYDAKKDTSLKIMAKKDLRLKEIQSILDDDLVPNLTKLKEERKEYNEFTKITRELEHLNKVYIAWQFLQAQEINFKSADDANEIKKKLESSQLHIEELNIKIKALNQQITQMEKEKDEEAGGKLQTLDAKLKELQMLETKISSRLQILKDALKEDNKKKMEVIKHFNEDQSSIAHKEKELEKLQSMVVKLQETCENDAKEFVAAQKQFQAISAGLSSNTEGEAATLADQLMSAKSDIANADTEQKQAQMKLTYAKKDIIKKQEACKKTSDSYKKDQSTYQLVEKEAMRIKQEVDKLCYEDGKEEKLQSEKRNLTRVIDDLREKLNIFYSRFPQLSFEYADPVKDFDRRKVLGLVCKLIKIKDPLAATALELTAGAKLCNVVVDNEVTGKQLLSRGRLNRRCTIIPLNKIAGRPIENEVVKRAQNLVGKENVRTALSIVEYDNHVETAMQYVFGNTFVCSNMEAAKAVAFADGIKKRSVTIDGEVFDPAGTLSGGSMGQRNKMLLELTKINEVEEQLNQKQQQLAKVVKELSQINAMADRHRTLQQKFEIKEREAELLKSRLEQSTHHQQLEEVQTIQNSIEEQQLLVAKCQEVKKNAENRVKDLQLKLNDSKSVREQELKNAEKAVSESKKHAEVSSKKFKEVQQVIDSLQLEIEEIRKGLSIYEEQIIVATETLKNHEVKRVEIEAELKVTKNSVAEAANEVKTQKDILKAHSAEIVKLHKERDTLVKGVDNEKLHIQQLQHDVAKSMADSKDAEDKVERYLSKYSWIAKEKKFFGVPNTEYDFVKNNPQQAANRINKLQEVKEKLSKKVNTRAQTMLDSVEQRYKDLKKKKAVVLDDKLKIVDVIEGLDDKKRCAIITACEKVDKDFGSIFSSLLPGARARLVAPEGKTVLDGVEFKIAFGDVWKESLTELSGGQRSLVALSLILAMLLFNPAPIYILDEIDAALDISHTQNIGQMLKTHFRHSQFIIVSLKDGMFSNANVLFKTKFVDGMSTVTREDKTCRG